MKVIIAGSRDIDKYNHVINAVNQVQWEVEELVNGDCSSGVDQLALQYARQNSIPVELFPADWQEHGKAAGPIRNKQMVEYADALLAIWDGQSSGTENIINEALDKDLELYVHQPKDLK